MRALPAGTVTFLFTDIEGSTRLLERLGEGYPAALAAHRRALREAFARHGGVEVDTQGDAFFVAFADAAGALAAAGAGQAALADGPLRVRMGLHTGEPIVWEEGYAGLDVHRGARICAAAHGGQVLVSERTRALVDGGALRDLGLHRLKDLSTPQRLFQLGDGSFPPLRTLHATNLPTQPGLVGRRRELAEAGALLREHRLLTLIGPGGSGKTRLGLQLAAEAVDDHPDGVWWVPLQAVTDPALVLPSITQELGARDDLAGHLAGRRLLLLLDNLEQVVEAAPALADLLARAPGLRLLVTSREPLRLAGEQRYPVDPLEADDAVTLFVERARAVDPAFTPAPEVAAICRRLDGLPLAVELAAARVAVLRPAELLKRLERALPLLAAGRRDAPARQRTLRATIAWSHDLLDAEERRLLRSLAVFAASFELEAAEEICEAGLDGVQSLLEKSLLRRWGSGRLGMLETIREYAEERLAESGEEDELRRRHAAHYMALARSANLASDATGAQRHDLASAEIDNFRRVLGWAASAGDVAAGLELLDALEGLWVARDPHEAVRWYEALLARAAGVPPELHAAALLGYGGQLFISGDFEGGSRLYEQSLAEWQALGDEARVAHVLMRLTMSALVAGDGERARELGEQSLELERRAGRRGGESMALGCLAEVEWRGGNRERGLELAAESAAIARAAGLAWWDVNMSYLLCEWSLELGRDDDAERHGRDSLAQARRIDDRQHSVYLLALFARMAAERGRLEHAGLLWGALEAEAERGPVGQWEAERDAYAAPVLAHACDGFARGRERGRGLSLDEAAQRALASG